MAAIKWPLPHAVHFGPKQRCTIKNEFFTSHAFARCAAFSFLAATRSQLIFHLHSYSNRRTIRALNNVLLVSQPESGKMAKYSQIPSKPCAGIRIIRMFLASDLSIHHFTTQNVRPILPVCNYKIIVCEIAFVRVYCCEHIKTCTFHSQNGYTESLRRNQVFTCKYM